MASSSRISTKPNEAVEAEFLQSKPHLQKLQAFHNGLTTAFDRPDRPPYGLISDETEARAPAEPPVQLPNPANEDVRPGSAHDKVAYEVAKDGDDEQVVKRGRGRPLQGPHRRTETSFSLSGGVVKEIRKLAAHDQIRLDRSVSSSEVCERLLLFALAHVRDNAVMPGDDDDRGIVIPNE